MRRLLIVPLAVLGVAAIPAAATAAPVVSQVTTPADGFVTVRDADAPSPATITYAGTSNAPSTAIDIVCVKAAAVTAVLATTTTDATGRFTVDGVPPAAAPAARTWCRVRAAPAAMPPAPTSSGPDVFFGVMDVLASAGKDDDYRLTLPISRRVGVDLTSWANCGLTAGLAYEPAGLQSAGHFACNGATGRQDVRHAVPGLLVDGHTAVGPYEAGALAPAGAGRPAFTVTRTSSPDGFRSTVQESDPIVRCTTDAFPPAGGPGGSCASFTPSGVQVDRRIDLVPLAGTGFDETAGQVVMTDTWHSTDGAAHNVENLVTERYHEPVPGPALAADWLDGTLAVLPTAGSLPVPAGDRPRSWISQRSLGAPDTDLDTWGATTLYPPPDTLRWADSSAFDTHEAFTVPATGNVVRTRIYSMAGTRAMARLARTLAEDRAVAPRVTAAAPATVYAAGATVTGTVTDPGGTDTLTVGGRSAAIGADGTFAAPVTLQPGVNAVAVRATDSAGQTADTVATVTRITPKATAQAAAKVVFRGRRGKAATLAATLNGPGTVRGSLRGTVTYRVTVGRGRRARSVRRTARITAVPATAPLTAAGRVPLRLTLTGASARALARAGRRGGTVRYVVTGTFAGGESSTDARTIRIRV